MSNPTGNIEALREHLDKDSFAINLIDAYKAAAPEKREETLKKLAEKQLKAIRVAMEQISNDGKTS